MEGADAGIIPCFEWGALEAWMRGEPPDAIPPGPRMSPGGFQSFDHRWALPEAFRFHERIGRARVTARIHELADALQGRAREAAEGEAAHAARRGALGGPRVLRGRGHDAQGASSSGSLARKIVASDTPYAPSYARLTPSLLNTPEEVDRTVAGGRRARVSENPYPPRRGSCL